MYQQLLHKKILLLFVFFVLAIILYVNAIFNEFTFDDINNIQYNQYLRSFKGIASLAFSPVHSSEVLRGYLYRPFAAFIEYLIGSFFGFTPVPFHIANIIFYILNCFVLFLVIKELFDPETAFIAALIFLFHPIHTEVVASAVCITELLAFLFGMLSLLLFLKSSHGTAYLVLSSFCYLLALLSKETSIILPLIIVLIACYRNGSAKSFGRIIFWYGISFSIYFALRFLVIGSFLQSQGNLIPYLSNPLSTLPFDERLLNAVYLLGKYLYLLIMPVHLSADYSYNSIPILTSAASLAFISALIVHIVLLSIAIYSFKKNKLLSFSILVFYVSILPSSNILFVSGTIMGERLIYLSSIGFATGITALVLSIRKSFARGIVFLYVVIVFIIIYFGWRTIDRNKDWKNNYTLFQSVLQIYPDNAKANYDFAVLSYMKGDKVACRSHAEKTISLYPQYHKAHMLLAQLEIEQSNYQDAEKILLALPMLPDTIEQIHLMLSDIYMRTNQTEKEQVVLEQGFEKIPGSFNIAYNLALVYLNQQNYTQAEFCLNRALTIIDSPDVHFQLGTIFLLRSDYVNALPHFNKGLSSQQYGKASLQYLAFTLIQLKQYQNAIAALEQYLYTYPDDLDTQVLIAYSYWKSGNSSQASSYWNKLHILNQPSCSRLRFPILCSDLFQNLNPH